MNKTVSVTNMQVKAHAEEGLLINEESGATTSWDNTATANVTKAIELRPASTSDLSTWWHANSKISAEEAGQGTNGVDTDKTVATGTDTYYKDISNLTPNTTSAVAGSNAEQNVYYDDATYGTANQYDNGEGYYVQYKYYLKSSGTDDLKVAAGKLTANVTAELQGGTTQGSAALDKALRVGIKVDDEFIIVAPLGEDASYVVTSNEKGVAGTTVTPSAASTEVVINDSDEITIPDVNDNTGKEVDVYIWFEGEDTNCKSDNITASLDTYQIDITFTDSALGE